MSDEAMSASTGPEAPELEDVQILIPDGHLGDEPGVLRGAVLIRHVEDFMRRHRMSRSGFSRRFVKDPSFVSGLYEGREPRTRTIKRLISEMAAYDEQSVGQGEGI